jgi:hypothetical protein
MALTKTTFSMISGAVANVLDFGADPTGIADSTTAIQAAHNASPEVFYPLGTYKISSSIVLPSGSKITGECSGSGGSSAPSTIIQTTTSAYAYTMDSPVGATIEGPRFNNIQINAQNGIRLNSITGGQPGQVGATQGFINNASFKKTFILKSGTTAGTGLQASVAFHLEFTEQSEILGFNKNIDIYYSDFVLIAHCRLWQFITSNISLTAANTFGSHSVIENNDLLSGATGSTAFIICNDINPTIRHNYIEQVVAEGTGLTAAIMINSGVQKATIENNTISFPSSCGPNWLNVTSSGSLGSVIVNANTLIGTGGVGPALFNGGLGLQAYYNSGSAPTICNHSGNTFETGIPFNTLDRSELPASPYKTVSVLTPGFYNSVKARDYGINAYVNNNNLVLPPSAGGNNIWFVDPDNPLTENVSVYVLAYATGPQTISANVADNYVSISSVSLSLTTKPTWFQVTPSVTAATELEIYFNNATSGGANTAYIKTVVVNTP